MLTIADVEKSFAREPVLRGVSLTVARGETVVLRGSNGAGKSTLCEIVAGVLAADRGAVMIDGRRRSVGYAPANAVLPEHLILHEWIDLLGALRDARAKEIDAAVMTWGLSACTGTRLAALSLGQRRRLALAAAELGAPTWLLLDEPTVGLDPEGIALLVARVNEHVARGGGAMIATHDEAFASAFSARIVRLEAGSIVSSS